MPEVRGGREIRHLVDDGVGPCRNHRSAHAVGIEAVGNDRLRTQSPHKVCFCRTPCRADHRMTRGDQRRNKILTDRAGRARNKDAHPVLLNSLQSSRT